MSDAAGGDEELARLLAAIRACRICVDEPRRAPLPHPPRPVVRARTTATIAVCGQAPGTRVHASGLPFSDPSGDRLRQWMGVSPDEFYDETRIAIIPMGFCFPGLDAKGGDRPPRPECAPAWRTDVFRRLPGLELILMIGRHAQAWHLGADRATSLADAVGRWRGELFAPRRPRQIALPHPSWRNNAWLARHPWFEADVLPALRAEIRALLGPPPQAALSTDARAGAAAAISSAKPESSNPAARTAARTSANG